MNIKFRKHNVTNGSTTARVHYSLDNRIDGRACVTLYEKDYENNLRRIFPGNYQNGTDWQTDYCEKDRVTIFADNPLYPAARETAEAALNPVIPACEDQRIVAFAEAVEAAEIASLVRRGSDCEANRQGVKTRIIPGKKYTKVDIGCSGAYMIDQAGNIYGIKAYGVPHFGHCYGTLDAPKVRSRF